MLNELIVRVLNRAVELQVFFCVESWGKMKPAMIEPWFCKHTIFYKEIKEQIGWWMYPRGRGEPCEYGCLLFGSVCCDCLFSFYDDALMNAV